MTLQDEIKESLKLYSPNIVVSYGRSFDTALATYKDEIQEWFAFIDPICENRSAMVRMVRIVKLYIMVFMCKNVFEG